MLLQTQSLTPQLLSLSISFSKPLNKTQFNLPKPNPHRKKPSFKSLKCSLSVISDPTHLESMSSKPDPAEVSRTIMELTSVGTLSTLTQDGWPLGIGVRFAVDPEGTPVMCLNASNRQFSIDRRSSLHVQLEQCGLRTPQCTIQGSLDKPEDRMLLKRLYSIWKKKFGEEVDEDLVYVIVVDRILQIEDFKELGVWVTSSDYRNANPDPLRDFAEKIVDEINTNNMEDVHRFCNVFVDLDFQVHGMNHHSSPKWDILTLKVSEAKMIWVDRLGFDMRLCSPQNGIFEVRIPFPREVTDEKGAKSSFNCMSQLAWEVERNYHVPDFKKVKQLKQMR